ncbi:MAG: chorismate lyase [Nitrosomonas sp.]|nr:chorismate lyase [Nitrosomonas sp.]
MKADPSSAWHPVPVCAPAEIRWWLQHRESLTRLIQMRCRLFRVEPVFQALATSCVDELTTMNLRRLEQAIVREVYLYSDNMPVVFAHSVVKKEHLQAAWRGLSRLGNQSLGSMLFGNPLIHRTAFSFKKLRSGHPLYERACKKLADRPADLWARRSLFTLRTQPILVTEVFLPMIYCLKR